MPATHDVCVSTGEYQDQEGQTKRRWKNIGVKIVSDKGEFIKLDALPIPNAEGEVWLTLFPKKPKEGSGYTQAPKSPSAATQEPDTPF